MVGIYFNGNGKYQGTLNDILKGLPINIRTKNTLLEKLTNYKNFYNTGEVSSELEHKVKVKYHISDNINMATAAYIEDDLDRFLKKIQDRYNL